MAIDFPSSPIDGQTYTNANTGLVYVYNNTYSTWDTSTGSTAGFVGYTGSAGSSATITKTLDYTGTLVVSNGTKKWWINKTYTLNRLVGFLDTAPTGSNAIFRVNKNSSNVGLFTINASSTSVTNNISISVVQGDYITVDIVQVGSTVAGSDLALIFEYS